MKINKEIKIHEALIIKNKDQLGKMKIKQAQILADEAGLDLVLVNEKPAVAKIMDYAKFLFQQKKAKKKSKKSMSSEIRLGPNIGVNDMMTKENCRVAK